MSKNCSLLAKIAAFLSAGAGIFYLMNNYEIEFTIKKKIKLHEDNNELYVETEYLDIEGAYVTAEGAVADRYVASEPVIISKEAETSQELEAEIATEAVDEPEIDNEPEAETTAEPDELTASAGAESEADSISEDVEEPAAEVKEEKEPQILDKAVGDFDDDDDYDKKDVEGVSYQKL